ncbi:MAG: hypothetical protein ACT4TC_10630 [Myxococcaceae bacterium]
MDALLTALQRASKSRAPALRWAIVGLGAVGIAADAADGAMRPAR